MERRNRRGAAPEGDSARSLDQLPGRIDWADTELRRGVQAITTPREAVEAMLAAGAEFKVESRGFTFGLSFTYQVKPSGDLDRARAILAAVKAKPPAFLMAFKTIVQQVAGNLD